MQKVKLPEIFTIQHTVNRAILFNQLNLILFLNKPPVIKWNNN